MATHIIDCDGQSWFYDPVEKMYLGYVNAIPVTRISYDHMPTTERFITDRIAQMVHAGLDATMSHAQLRARALPQSPATAALLKHRDGI